MEIRPDTMVKAYFGRANEDYTRSGGGEKVSSQSTAGV